MTRSYFGALAFALAVTSSSMAATGSDFAARCAQSGVIKCVGFDDPRDIGGGYGSRAGVLSGASKPTLDTSVKASGTSSLKFTIPSNSGADTSGSYFSNFTGDLSVQFGENEEFYIQWRQRFSPEFLDTRYQGGGGWKQVIIGAGDRPGRWQSSCTALEVVVQNTYQRGFPQMYNSCTGSTSHGPYNPFEEPLGASDFKLENARPSPYCLYSQGKTSPFPPTGNCFPYAANEWMTFQVKIKTGPRVKDEFADSFVTLWVGRESRPSEMVMNWGPYNLTAGKPAEGLRFGKIWLLPYNTGKDASQTHPTAYTWYDELIISRTKIPDPVATSGSPATSPPVKPPGPASASASSPSGPSTSASTSPSTRANTTAALASSPGAHKSLGQLAASMQPGTWVVLNTQNLQNALGSADVGGGASGGILGYADKAAWDPTSRQLLFIGSDHLQDNATVTQKFISYSDVTNAWTVMPRPPWAKIGTNHGYDQNAIDVVRGQYYSREAYTSRTFWQYDIAAKTWSSLPVNNVLAYPSCCAGVEYFPGLGLVWVQGGEVNAAPIFYAGVFLFDENLKQWARLDSPRSVVMGVYHNIAAYNPVHKVLIFGGGNDSTDLYKLDARGAIVKLKNAPMPFGIMASVVTVDPVTGDYLFFFRDGSFWVYNVANDTWARRAGSNFFDPVLSGCGAVCAVIATPVSTYGVVMFVKYNAAQSRVYVYKHTS